MSSVMAYIPEFTTSGWPQSALNGIKVGDFWFDAYEASQPDASGTSPGTTTLNAPGTVASVSQSGKVLWHSISWLNARIAASNRIISGRPCHLVTPFERFAVLSLVMASGLWGQLRGNNDDGKDTRTRQRQPITAPQIRHNPADALQAPARLPGIIILRPPWASTIWWQTRMNGKIAGLSPGLSSRKPICPRQRHPGRHISIMMTIAGGTALISPI